MMHASLEKHMRVIRQQREQLNQWFDTLSAEQQAFKPAPNEWSFLETMDHLLIVDSGVLAGAEKKLASDKAFYGRDWTNRTRFWFIRFIFWRNIAVPTPGNALDPRTDLDAVSLRADWLATGERWEERIRTWPQSELNRQAFRHPIAGRMPIAQTLVFLRSHNGNHIRQIEKLVKSPNFKGTQ